MPEPVVPGHRGRCWGARGRLPIAPSPVPPLAVERLLSRVRKPGRYAGGEWNSVDKDWGRVALKWCLAYPDLYEIGMSNLGCGSCTRS